MKPYLYLLSILLMFFSSCEKDKNDFNYNDINELGAISGIEPNYYTIFKSSVLQIKPKINFTQDAPGNGKYNYEWKAVPASDNSGKGRIIGTDKDLEYAVDLTEGVYTLYLKIKDEISGILWITQTTVTVSSPLSRGFLLMGENSDGNIRLDMISMPAGKDTSIVIRDMLLDKGLPTMKRPVSVQYTGKPKAGAKFSARLWVMTEDGGCYVDPKTLEYTAGNHLDGMIFTSFPVPADLGPVEIAPRAVNGNMWGTNHYILCNNGYVFAAGISGGEYYQNPINRLSKASVDLFRVAPFLMYAPGNDYGPSAIVLYDTDNNRFVGGGSPSTGYMKLLSDKDTDLFPWNQGEDGPVLKYAENTIYADIRSGYTFALMQKGTNYDIYSFTALATPAKKGKYSIQPCATNFSNASHYAFSSDRTLLFYSVNSKLYAYDYNTGRERIQDFGDFGGEITMLKFNIQGCYQEPVKPWTNHNETINDLYIATYNTSDGGRLRKVAVGTNPDVIEITFDPKSDWTGLSKIVDMDWRND